MANTNAPEEVKAIAQEFWPDAAEKQAVTYEYVNVDENGPERWMLKEALTGDCAHLFKNQAGEWVEYP